ncbi:MAG: mannose-1-phosphate guanylyltransferase [Saprospiraceae bacterium]
MNNNYVAIMAGGVGSRFWPASSEEKPKQFLDIAGTGKSLLEETYMRFKKVFPKSNIFIVTNSKYKKLVQNTINDIAEENIIIEPSRNNTAPSVAYTTFKLHSLNKDANIVIAPSDHIISKEKVFLDKIQIALEFTKNNDSILTLGITPDRPDTGYGYIEKGQKINDSNLYTVQKFKEKPDYNTALSYIESGNYLWNAGIFIFSAQNMMSSLKKYASEIYKIFNNGVSIYNTEKESEYINSEYPKSPKYQ